MKESKALVAKRCWGCLNPRNEQQSQRHTSKSDLKAQALTGYPAKNESRLYTDKFSGLCAMRVGTSPTPWCMKGYPATYMSAGSRYATHLPPRAL